MSDDTLFERWGGTRKMAEDIGERPSTVQSWKAVGRIPSTKQRKVLRIGRRLGMITSAEDVVFPMGRPAEAAA